MKRLLTTLVILTGLLGSAGAVWAQDFNKGLKAAQSGDFATALKEWRPLAEQGFGFADAQFNLGLMYALGDGVTQDYAEKDVRQLFRYTHLNPTNAFKKYPAFSD